MKTRIITGTIIAIICAIFIPLGGVFTSMFAFLIGLIGIYEMLTLKEKKDANDKFPIYLKIIVFIFYYLFIFGIPNMDYSISYKFNEEMMIQESFGINIVILSSFLFVLFAITVIDKKVKLFEMCYLFVLTILISIGLKGFLYLRYIEEAKSIATSSYNFTGLFMIVWIIITTCFTDIFAYFGGMLFYKIKGEEKVHKLNVRISPKKTIEGTIVGTIFGMVAGSLIFGLILNNYISEPIAFYIYIPLSFLLSIAGQFGDLFLSAVKRTYDVKDFGNILPGHGGILDRIDSLLINCLLAATIISIVL